MPWLHQEPNLAPSCPRYWVHRRSIVAVTRVRSALQRRAAHGSLPHQGLRATATAAAAATPSSTNSTRYHCQAARLVGVDLDSRCQIMVDSIGQIPPLPPHRVRRLFVVAASQLRYWQKYHLCPCQMHAGNGNSMATLLACKPFPIRYRQNAHRGWKLR